MKLPVKRQFPRLVTQKKNFATIDIKEFQQPHPVNYPSDNSDYFEQWYMNNFRQEDIREREYLPVLWTAVQCMVNHRQRYPLMRLSQFINQLDRSKKYYSIIQHDDGCKVDLTNLDIKIFSMTGKPCDYPIPLLCMPHKYNYGLHRDILANFVGKVTHPLRTQLVNTLNKKNHYHISTATHSMKDFCRILARSVFTLCPRGYGISSFRICEAIQYGSIPVYISDEFIIPYNKDFNEYGVLIDAKDVPVTDKIIASISPIEIKRKQDALRQVKELYTYEGCKKMILEQLENGK